MQYVYRGVVFLSEKMMLAMFLNDREYGQLFDSRCHRILSMDDTLKWCIGR